MADVALRTGGGSSFGSVPASPLVKGTSKFGLGDIVTAESDRVAAAVLGLVRRGRPGLAQRLLAPFAFCQAR